MMFVSYINRMLYSEAYAFMVNSLKIGRKFSNNMRLRSYKSADHDYVMPVLNGRMNNLLKNKNSEKCFYMLLTVLIFANNWKMNGLYTSKDEKIIIEMIVKYVNHFRGNAFVVMLYYLFSVDFRNEEIWSLLHKTYPETTDKQWMASMLHLGTLSNILGDEMPYVDNFIMAKRYALNKYSDLPQEIEQFTQNGDNSFNWEKFYSDLPPEMRLGIAL